MSQNPEIQLNKIIQDYIISGSDQIFNQIISQLNSQNLNTNFSKHKHLETLQKLLETTKISENQNSLYHSDSSQAKNQDSKINNDSSQKEQNLEKTSLNLSQKQEKSPKSDKNQQNSQQNQILSPNKTHLVNQSHPKKFIRKSSIKKNGKAENLGGKNSSPQKQDGDQNQEQLNQNLNQNKNQEQVQNQNQNQNQEQELQQQQFLEQQKRVSTPIKLQINIEDENPHLSIQHQNLQQKLEQLQTTPQLKTNLKPKSTQTTTQKSILKMFTEQDLAIMNPQSPSKIEQNLQSIRERKNKQKLNTLGLISLKQFIQLYGHKIPAPQITKIYAQLFDQIYELSENLYIYPPENLQLAYNLIAKILKFNFSLLQQEYNLIQNLQRFLSQSENHLQVAFNLLLEITKEMSFIDKQDISVSVPIQKKNIISFRESIMLNIMNFPFEFFTQELEKIIGIHEDYNDLFLVSSQLMIAVLHYNYNGSIYQEDPEHLQEFSKQPLLIPARIKKEQQPNCYHIIRSDEFLKLIFDFLQYFTEEIHYKFLKKIMAYFNSHYKKNKEFIYSAPEIFEHFIFSQSILIYQLQFQYFEQQDQILEQFLENFEQISQNVLTNPALPVKFHNLIFDFWAYFDFYLQRNYLLAENAGKFLEDLVKKYIESKLDLVELLLEPEKMESYQYKQLHQQKIIDPLNSIQEIKTHLKYLGTLSYSNIEFILHELFLKFQTESEIFKEIQSQLSLKKLIWLAYIMIFVVKKFIKESEKMTVLANNRQDKQEKKFTATQSQNQQLNSLEQFFQDHIFDKFKSFTLWQNPRNSSQFFH
ncbi:hypothetical protein PPERSA_02036 [Pseudocohnilembus persalinus]|uniref:Uncharacterized protein n=1 Tax=Pseudocohnilembus persalinus TaxID=266149 RepID=A0A0V0QF94_PSEPJ|nr:hypothetical protein PPERSA_02036 [Pseudocohnilembus persalinus]|eukprot:KRX00857.1 hypothetical protein PPERSA_02036 [Pseudocohnilembus persalinus]